MQVGQASGTIREGEGQVMRKSSAFPQLAVLPSSLMLVPPVLLWAGQETLWQIDSRRSSRLYPTPFGNASEGNKRDARLPRWELNSAELTNGVEENLNKPLSISHNMFKVTMKPNEIVSIRIQ